MEDAVIKDWEDRFDEEPEIANMETIDFLTTVWLESRIISA